MGSPEPCWGEAGSEGARAELRGVCDRGLRVETSLHLGVRGVEKMNGGGPSGFYTLTHPHTLTHI